MASDSRTRTLLKYGISPSDYDKLLAAQGGVCAICKKKPGKIRLAVDHDHEIQKKYGVIWVRGLLHVRCNRYLAAFEYDTEVLTNLKAYVTLIINKRRKYEKEDN